MKQYKAVNTLMGWFTFLIAAIVYCMTAEPTASFWDCPEFITTAYKLEVGHPPGAPFFMLMGNLFTQFTSDVTLVAKMVNYMSALMSAACIMFLFWSITHLVRKLVVRGLNVTTTQMVTIIGSGLVGALVYTFSDTFWFSAVEGEVYAFSSLFTALVFWLILKWEDVADEAHSDRWLILIAYLTGLSIGVHLLNLLCIPAIVLVYYYKKNPVANLKGSLLALLGSAVLVGVVLYGIVPGVVKVGGAFELLFVNGLGMPFNSGVVVYIVLLIAAIIWGVYESYTCKSRTRMNLSFLLTIAMLGIPFYGHGATSACIGILVMAALAAYLFLSKENSKFSISARTLNTALLCLMTIMVGYSSYALIVIRSTANPPMDQNSPEDIFTLGDYLGREQYGSRPLFYGPAFSSQVQLDVSGQYCVPREASVPSKWLRKEKASADEKDSYVEMPGRTEYVYAQNVLFPRMYSSAHAKQYNEWVNISGYDVPYDQCGETVMVNIPTFMENLKFFFSYQLNFMYMRYFMWNFVGRQNDIQGSGEIENGNWITGIKAIDNVLVGDQDLLPTVLKENKGRNVYYGIPFILGILGMIWQSARGRRGIQQFWVVFFLFFMTGIAIVLYLNQTPTQPRERDYAYAGSFYAYAIWVGMGVAALIHYLRKAIKYKPSAPIIAVAVSLLCILVPLQMASQNWDDHDRSQRYMCRDFGQNYLMTLQESGDPIIFTNGDNDTFPLWYNQEVEGVRTDARTCNLSYLQTDWYIDQMKRPSYDSPSLPITWDRIEYVEGTNDYVRVRPDMMKQIDELYAKSADNPEALAMLKETFGENPYELKNIIEKWILADDEKMHFIPTDSIVLKVDRDAVLRSGMTIPEMYKDSLPEYMHISLKGKRALFKGELMTLEMLANANWERPIYVAITVGSDSRLALDNNFVQEGLAYRITPFDSSVTGHVIDSEKMYDNLMNKFKYGNVSQKGVYIEENTMRMCYTHRNIFTQLIDQLLIEGKDEKALAALEYCEKVIPAYNVPYEYRNGAQRMAEAYYILGKPEKGEAIVDAIANTALEYITWYLSMSDAQLLVSFREVQLNLAYLDDCIRIFQENESPLADQYTAHFDELYKTFALRVQVAKEGSSTNP